MLHMKIVAETAADPRRRETRIPLFTDIGLRPLGATAVEARLVNISSSGFMAETHAVIDPGARIWLTLPAVGRVNALVLWGRGGRLGGEFAQPLDPLAVIQAAGLS